MIHSTLISTYFLRLPTAFVWNPINIIPSEETAALHHHRYSWRTQLCHRPIFLQCVSILMYFPFFVFKHHRSGAMTVLTAGPVCPLPTQIPRIPTAFLLPPLLSTITPSFSNSWHRIASAIIVKLRLKTQVTDLIADLILKDLQNIRTQTTAKTTHTSTKSRSVYV